MVEPVATAPGVEIPPVESLTFAKSESKPVGVHGTLMDKLRANSMRIVGTMKLVGDITAGFSGNPFLIGYALFAGIGRIIMIAYGTKAHQNKVADAKEGAAPEKLSAMQKVRRPSEYPMEAAAGMSVIGETSGTLYGVTELMHHAADGWTPLLFGLLGIWSYANILLGKEKKKTEGEAKDGEQQSLTFANSESKPVGWMGKLRQTLKENPVLTSSLVNIVIGTGIVIGGIIGGSPVAYIAAGAILLAANIVQALLVKKREFNVEGALEDRKLAQQQAGAAPEQPAGAHSARVVEERKQREAGGDVAMAPA